MPETKKERWESTLEIVEESIGAKSFVEDLPYLQETYGDDPGLLAAVRVGMLTEVFVEMVGLYAALLLPKDEVSDALAQVRERLNNLDFESSQAELDGDELPYYEAYADFASFVFGEIGNAMEAMFNIYIAEDYDPEADPNVLIEQALPLAYEDLDAAKEQISRAAATTLHGQRLWWRWEREAYGPAAAWVNITTTLVEDYVSAGDNPLGPPEEARENMQAIVARVERQMTGAAEADAEEEEPEDEEPASTPIDDLIEELIEGKDLPITEEQIALCQAHRKQAIAALTHLARDEVMQMEDAPGEGYAPIRAVELLGELEAAEAAPTLIDLLADGDPMEIIYSAASRALERLGPLARDDVLTFLRYSHDVGAKTALASLLDSMTDRDDDEAYRLLVEIWEETSWDDGKAILGYPLVYLGGEDAAERIRQALAQEDLDPIDHNELVVALEEGGMDAPPSKELGEFHPSQEAIRGLGNPEEFLHFAEAMPEIRGEPEELVQEYVTGSRGALMRGVSFLLVMETDGMEERVDELLESIEALTFEDPPPGYPDYVLAAYAHLTESAGPEIRDFGLGMLLPIKAYLDQEYDPAKSPDDLIAAAREALPDTEQARQLFTEAGALALDGKPVWELWPFETPRPLDDWMIGFLGVRNLLESMDQIPFDPSAESPDPSRLWMAQEVSPEVEAVLDFLFEQNSDWIAPKDRPDFGRHRSDLIPQLMRILRNPAYADGDAPGRGWAPVLAARILGALRAREAADMLVEMVILTTPTMYLHDAAIFSLIALGPPALAAVKRYYRYGQSIAKKATLAEVLGLVGQDDPQVFHLLREVWETASWTDNRRAIALAFGDLGDRRAEPLLREAMRDPRADTLDRTYAWLALMELGIDAPPPPRTLSDRLRTIAPASPRVVHDEFDRPQRIEYTAWGEGICPDCGQLVIEDESGRWVHLGTHSSKSSKQGRQRIH